MQLILSMSTAYMNYLDYLTFLFIGDLNCRCPTCRFNLPDERHMSIIAHPTFPASVLKIAILAVIMVKIRISDKLRF